jgi:hypothetical protein
MTIASDVHGYCPCADCGWDTTLGEWFMVHDDIWLTAAMDADGGGLERWLCVGCLERRLGRLLNPADFKDVPLHDRTWEQTPRLRSRMHRTNA